MNYEDLLQQARSSELFQDQATMESAVKAVLGIFASRLDEEPARRFTSVLPKPLTYDVLRGGQANVTNITAGQYVDRVAEQFHLRREHAQRLISSLLRVVTENLPGDVFTIIRNNLPMDWNEFLQKGSVTAAEEKQEGKMDMQAMMEAYRKLATPGPPHKLLERMAGSWTTRFKSWMEPDQPPEETTGTCEQKMILGGRFLQQEFGGEMMGSPFEGFGIMGYDNHTKKYFSTWMDTMGTAMVYFEGTAGADGKTITQTGRYDDPVQGPMEFRSVTAIVDDDTLTIEMYSTGKSGKETKMMEGTYSRKHRSEGGQTPGTAGENV